MKQRNRKRFDAAFKARVALEAAQEKESLAQLGKRYGVHPVLVGQWKKQLFNFMAGGGDGLAVLTEGKAPRTGPIDTDVIEAYTRANNPLPTPQLGRVTLLP
jgi:transposase-like protein